MSTLRQMLFLLMVLWGIVKSLCAAPIVLHWLLLCISYLYYFSNRIIFHSGLSSILLLIQIHVLRHIKMFPFLPFQRGLPLAMMQQKELSKVETLLKSQSSCPTWFLAWNADAAVSWDLKKKASLTVRKQGLDTNRTWTLTGLWYRAMQAQERLLAGSAQNVEAV